MLKRASLYKDQLQKAFIEAYDNPRYHYFNTSSYYSETEIDTSTWNKEQFVSVDKDGNLIGYMSVNHDRELNYISCIGIVNFVDLSDASEEIKNKARKLYGLDLKNFFRKILKQNLDSIKIGAVADNPAVLKYINIMENSKYQWLCQSYRIQDDKFPDGKLYDAVSFRVFLKPVEIHETLQVASDLFVKMIQLKHAKENVEWLKHKDSY